MTYFDGFDINGNPCRIEETGNGTGFVRAYESGYLAVRLAASTYMATNGQVYAASRGNCSSYATPEWRNWAKRQMYAFGLQPDF